MKTLFTTLLLLCCISCFAQDSIPIRDKRYIQANIDGLSYDHHLTPFADMYFFDVDNRIQGFMQSDRMQFTMKGEPTNNNTIYTETYIPQISTSSTQHTIQFKYFIKNTHSDSVMKKYIITRCEITGYLDYLINFYVKYWNTTIQKGEKQNEIVYNRLWNDYISFQFFPDTKQGKITITNTKAN